MIHQHTIKNLLIAAIALAVVNIVIMMALNPAVAPAQVSGRQRIMYKVTHVKDEEREIQTVVDIFSRDGWELVTHYNEILIFKKQQ